MGERGIVHFYNNWIKDGWKVVHGTLGGSFTRHDNLTGEIPGFLSFSDKNFHLNSGSLCINTGTVLPDEIRPSNSIFYEYKSHQKHIVRSNDGVRDIGAFERFGVDNP